MPVGDPANRAHLEVTKASRKLGFSHGSHAVSAWQKNPLIPLKNMAKIRLSVSFFDASMTVLDVAFSTWSESDFPGRKTDRRTRAR
jgi:hypothetical protein